jgi:hypothetical protein
MHKNIMVEIIHRAETRNRAVDFVSWLFANNNEVILGNIII